MKWQDLVNMTPAQFNAMSQKDLKAATQVLASAGNKRLKRAQEQGFSSPSIEAVLAKGKFSTKDKSLNQLRNEFMRAKGFLQSKTGTLAAFNKFKKDSINSLKEKAGIEISPDQFDLFWRSYEELRKGRSDIASKKLKYLVLEEISEKIKDSEEVNIEDIVTQIQGDVDRMYEEEEQLTKQAEDQAAELNFWQEVEEQEVKPQKMEKRKNERKDRSAQKAARRKSRRKR